MSYAQKHLIAGETVQYETKLHWIVMAGHAAAAAVMEVLGLIFVIASFSSWKGAQLAPPRNALLVAAAISLVIGGVVLGIGLLKRNATEMAVTNKRVVVKTGITDRRTVELLLPRIESIAVEEPALGRVLGYGTVIVRGTGGTPEVFPQIARPLKFREQVQRQIAAEVKSS